MSTIFDSIGIDPGIIIIALMAIVVILIGAMHSPWKKLLYANLHRLTDCMKQKKIMNMQLKHWNSILKLFSANMA